MFPHFMILSYFPLTYLIQNRRSFKTSQWLQWVLVLATLSAIVGIIFHFMGKERTTSTYGGYYTLANMMAWSIPLSIALLLESKGRKTLIYGVVIVMQLLALWWTYTRSAMLALVGVIGIWFLFCCVQMISRKRLPAKQQLLRWTFILSLPVLLAVFTLTSPDPRINPFAKSENGQQEINELQQQWIEEYRNQLYELVEALEDISMRFDDLGDQIDERIQTPEYLSLVKKAFRLWQKCHCPCSWRQVPGDGIKLHTLEGDCC